MQGHILLSILAYSLLMLAALEAGVLAVEDHLLRARRPLRAVQVLPPLQTLKGLMFQLIGAGFFLLSLGLMSGMMFLNDIFAQHLVHKTVLSLVAWLVFAVLLFGRSRCRSRSSTAIRCTLSRLASCWLTSAAGSPAAHPAPGVRSPPARSGWDGCGCTPPYAGDVFSAGGKSGGFS